MDERTPSGAAGRGDPQGRVQLEAESRSDPTALVLHRVAEIRGEDELARPVQSLAFSGLAAGLTVGFSMVAEGVLRAHVPEASWSELVVSLGYTTGFVFVTLGKQQLYTETTLTAALPALHAPSRSLEVLRFWALVLAANLVGTLLFALGATAPGMFDPELRAEFLAMGVEAAELGFVSNVLRGIVAGWIMALMVWTLPAMGSARILLIVGATWLIAVADLSHVIVGSVEVGYAAIEGAIGWPRFAFLYILPALIGNSIGGVVFVALLNHAQVIKEKSGSGSGW